MTSAPEGIDLLETRATTWDAIIRGRASVRRLRRDPVPEEVVRLCIDAAGWAPSPHGRQPWRFAILTRDERKRDLATAMGSTWDQQLRLDHQPDDIVRIRKAKSEQRITGAPVVVIACLYPAVLDHYPDAERQQHETTMAIQSLGAAIQNLMLAAYAQGLDSGWMCAPLFCPDIVCRALGLDEALIPHALITLGYRAADPQRRPHLPVESLIVSSDLPTLPAGANQPEA